MTNRNKNLFLLIAAVIVIAIIVYLVSFFRREDEESIKQKRILLEKRNKKILLLITSKVELSKRLDRMFKYWYASVRIVILTLFICLTAKFIMHFNVHEVGQITDYWTLIFNITPSIFCIALDRVLDLTACRNALRELVKSWVYKKYLDIEEQILRHKEELSQCNIALETAVSRVYN
jgi:hypothetical protein